MKKFILFLMVALLSLTTVKSSAQSAVLMPLVAGDSISCAASLDTVSKVITVTGGYSALGIEVVATKVSGTVSGKAYLYSSLDGTNYTVTDSSSAFTNVTTNTAFFTKTAGLPYTYYKVQMRVADGANTTQVYIPRVYYVLKKFTTN